MYNMHFCLVFVIVSKLSCYECFDGHCVEHHGVRCLNGDQGDALVFGE